MDQIKQFIEPARKFAKDSQYLINRCTKPDWKEFEKIAIATAIGFAIMGFIVIKTTTIHKVIIRMRRAIRKFGIPDEMRSQVWVALVGEMIGDKYDAAKLLNEASKTIESDRSAGNEEEEEVLSILRQIEQDVDRTMPGDRLFDEGAEGGIKLRRILVAYSVHVNRDIAYCQGFNFIVALLLNVFEGDEEKSFRGFVCIVDHIFPSKSYFDHYLTGARADQFLLADFICDQLIKNPTTMERKVIEDITSSITLNWFISLFHEAVTNEVRLTIMDHFMIDGVRALFKFTMAILHLAFQTTPPSSCEVFNTIRTIARDLSDISSLLSLVQRIKLPKDGYFAIKRTFYMVQSSLNSDFFYMQNLNDESNRRLVANKPLAVQQLSHVKAPSQTLMSSPLATLNQHGRLGLIVNTSKSSTSSSDSLAEPKVCVSSDKSKVCVQSFGHKGRSHIRVINADVRSNERALMSPLRHCLVIGISSCGKIIIMARQSSRRNFKLFQEQDLVFHVHELPTEIFEGFYCESLRVALVLTHHGEIMKITYDELYDWSEPSQFSERQNTFKTETLLLRECHQLEETDRLNLRFASLDSLSNLLWIYVDCEDPSDPEISPGTSSSQSLESTRTNIRQESKSSNPFSEDLIDKHETEVNRSTDQCINQIRNNASCNRKILVVDTSSFDIFSAFTLHQNMGPVISIRTCLIAFCQFSNPMSNQFSSRIFKIEPTGKYEHLLSFSDVVDFMITVPDDWVYQRQSKGQDSDEANNRGSKASRSSPVPVNLVQTLRAEGSYQADEDLASRNETNLPISSPLSPSSLSRYYWSLMGDHSKAATFKERENPDDINSYDTKVIREMDERKAVLSSSLGPAESITGSDFVPMNMIFIFRNGKIALFEFSEPFAIKTRESQLDRYDYSKIIGTSKIDDDFVITILTVFDKLIKVVI